MFAPFISIHDTITAKETLEDIGLKPTPVLAPVTTAIVVFTGSPRPWSWSKPRIRQYRPAIQLSSGSR